jgi:hypothetical protein
MTEAIGSTPSDSGSRVKRVAARNLRRWLDITTLTLAILGIGFAIWQFWDSRQLRSDTQTILNNATTRYVAEFPDNIPEITYLVKGTCGSLKILVDVPGYGMYSDPESYIRYEEALSEAARAKIDDNFTQNRCAGTSRPHGGTGLASVQLLLWNPLDQDTQSIRKQFRDKPDPPTADDWRKKLLIKDSREQLKFLTFVEENRDSFKNVLKDKTPAAVVAFSEKVASDNASYEAFIKGVEAAHAEVETRLHRNKVEIRYAKLPVIYMRIWIRDSVDSVFSFDHTPTSGDETGIAFQSHDLHLLKTFDAMFEQHWQEAVCYEDYQDYMKSHPTAGVDEIRKLPNCGTNQ